MDKCRIAIYDCYVPLNDEVKKIHFDKIEEMEKGIQSYTEYEIVGRFFDECSATTPLNERPEFRKVMDKANTGQIDLVACIKNI